jgi:hypothetical protein
VSDTALEIREVCGSDKALQLHWHAHLENQWGIREEEIDLGRK